MPGGLTVKEREELMKEKITPAKVQSKQRRPVGDTGIADIYTEDKGQPPMGQDMGSAKPAKKMAKGGDVDEKPSVGKRLIATGHKAVGSVLGPIQNKIIDANEYLDKKTEDTLSKKQRAAIFGVPSKDREDFKKAREEMTKDSYKKGGKVSASSRGDGIAQRGKTKGRMV